jgi:hypothetical protein
MYSYVICHGKKWEFPKQFLNDFGIPCQITVSYDVLRVLQDYGMAHIIAQLAIVKAQNYAISKSIY